MRKVLIVISDINKSIQFEEIALGIKTNVELEYFLINSSNTEFGKFLEENKIKVRYFEAQTSLGKLLTIVKMWYFMIHKRYDVVHCHLILASLLGLFASRLAFIKKRIYTRHHSDIHHFYFPHGLKYDQYCNRIATDVVAITKNVEEILLSEGCSKGKIKIINHGLNMQKYVVDPTITDKLCIKYNLSENKLKIGVISRYIDWKGIEYIIEAYEKFLMYHPDCLLVLLNAKGSYSKFIKSKLEKLPDKSYLEIEFENEIIAFYSLFNIFVHCPINKTCEAFGQVYIEALASKVPSIFTLSGVASEFIVNMKNALVVDYNSPDEIFNAMRYIVNKKNTKQINEIKERGYIDVLNNYSMSVTISKHLDLYNDVC